MSVTQFDNLGGVMHLFATVFDFIILDRICNIFGAINVMFVP